MDSQKEWASLDAAFIGWTLMNAELPFRLEAFSGNALYCWRGMPTMKKYRTVKEVCDLTGLTRKHLYYFHHENVVRAVAYANYSVEGNDGYKLYDDDAVEKLQQIALYYQLGRKRDEIRDIILDPDYDSNLVLDTMLAQERKKRERIDCHIAALEYLKMTGTKNGLTGTMWGISLEELGRTLLILQKESEGQPVDMDAFSPEIFLKKLSVLLDELTDLDNTSLQGENGKEIVGEIIKQAKVHMGNMGVPFMLGLFVSVLGEGTVARDFGKKITPEQGKTVLRHILNNPER